MADWSPAHASGPSLPQQEGNAVQTAQVSVSGLFVYPVKSARGIACVCASLTATGFEWDRQWMIVNARGVFLTQRSHPQLACIVPEVTPHALVLTAPGLDALSVPLDTEGARVAVKVWDDACSGIDQGSAAGEWLSRAAGEPVRLLRVAPGMGRAANPKFAGQTPAPLSFPDGYPVLICNEASLEDLNTRLPARIPMERFRPNIVLRGLPAWAEDHIETLEFGSVRLRLVKPCVRCTIPSIDQQTGRRSTDPTPVLRKFRHSKTLRGVMFGENAVIEAGQDGKIERGAAGSAAYRAARREHT